MVTGETQNWQYGYATNCHKKQIVVNVSVLDSQCQPRDVSLPMLVSQISLTMLASHCQAYNFGLQQYGVGMLVSQGVSLTMLGLQCQPYNVNLAVLTSQFQPPALWYQHVSLSMLGFDCYIALQCQPYNFSLQHYSIDMLVSPYQLYNVSLTMLASQFWPPVVQGWHVSLSMSVTMLDAQCVAPQLQPSVLWLQHIRLPTLALQC